MKVKVSDYIADFLAEHGITNIFTVVGGGAMHMNDSFGHHSSLHCIYNHHEQASSIAAEAYFRVENKMAAVCVTSGPGAINALNGVAGAYMDSIPMLVLSGQAKSSITVRGSSLKLRTLGNQEFDIVSALGSMTKYTEMIMDAGRVRYCLEKALDIAMTGRPGPCWLDIPLDIQGAYVETDELRGYTAKKDKTIVRGDALGNAARKVAERIANAKRPVIYAGNGIRISGAVEILKRLTERTKIPVVTCWDSIDLIETENECYTGRGGTMGDRAGNFAVQNSDFLLCIGSRLNIYQVGYDVKTWAREAYVAVVDIDPEELKKPTIRVDMPICADAGEFMESLIGSLKPDAESNHAGWSEQCRRWKKQYPVVREKHYLEKGSVNIYAFIDKLGRMLPEGAVTVVANGSASVVGSQTYYIGKGQRFIMNCGLSSMGYDLPAAVGACVASGKREIICIAGDGSIQMNIQELQTIVTNQLPIKIFVINNGGYHQIRQTQNNVFHNGLIGVGPESGDLGFPDFEKLSAAYGIPYFRIGDNQEWIEKAEEILSFAGFLLCEVICSTAQVFEPKSATKKLEDGTLVSPPLEDMAPFLSRDELKANMYIDLVE
ncbi:thiamine pyrophosphate-binding protein [Lachnospiraceae bacterium 38-10]